MTRKRRNETQREEARESIPVPSASDWGRIPDDDLDLSSAHELYFGKSCQELHRNFSRMPIDMIDGLRWMPLRPFSYYLRCLAAFVMSDAVPASGAADLASAFLRLIEEKAKTLPAGIRANRTTVREAVAYVAAHQSRFDAKPEIYGDFSARAAAIDALLDAL